MKTKEQIFEEHIDFKRTSVRSENKIKDIKRYLWSFLSSTDKHPKEFTEADLTKHINHLHSKFKTGGINDQKCYIKVFIKWFYEDYPSRFKNLNRICRGEKAEKTYSAEQMLSLKEFEKMIESEKELFWKVYLLVFFYGGFRPTEACRLKWENVFFEKDGTIIKNFSTKNKKTFYKSLPDNATQYLKQWKEKNDTEWLFPSPFLEGEPIKNKAVYFRIKNLAKKVLDKDVTPYQLRHSIATIKYNDDNLMDDDVANQLGHTKNMKETYVNLSIDKQKTRARKMYVKPKKLTPQENDELKELRKEMEMVKVMLSKIISKKYGKNYKVVSPSELKGLGFEE